MLNVEYTFLSLPELNVGESMPRTCFQWSPLSASKFPLHGLNLNASCGCRINLYSSHILSINSSFIEDNTHDKKMLSLTVKIFSSADMIVIYTSFIF